MVGSVYRTEERVILMNEIEKEYVVDVKQTLWGILPTAPWFILVIVFMFCWVQMTKTIEGQAEILINIIVFVFAIIKLMGWIGRSSPLYLKKRK